ncbi:MAG TPA: hypothetical protein VMH40_08745 [Myxococcaceae bacterium]|nr:hypothetical protein [Myxococcaceae bacterium]
MVRSSRIRLVSLAVLGALAAGCSRQRPPAPEPPAAAAPRTGLTLAARDLTTGPGNRSEVTFRPETVVVPRAAVLKAIQSVSTDGTVAVFDGAEPALQALAPGKVVLLERVALRRVKAVARDGGRLAVAFEPATLPEAIQNGTLQWNVPVRFSTLARRDTPVVPRWDAPLRRLTGWVLPSALAAPRSYALSGEKLGWTYDLTATGGAQRVDLALDMKKSIANIEVGLQAQGYVPDFDSLASIEIADGVTRSARSETKNLSGEVRFSISAATKGDPGGFGKKQVRLPAILKAPFFLGALPMTLEISTAITFTPGLGANHQLATANFKVQYTDLGGFSFQGGQKSATKEGGGDGDGEIVDFKGVTLAGIGVVAGVSMPRLEARIGTTSLADMVEKALPTGLADALQHSLFGGAAARAMGDVEESIKTEGALHVQVVLVGSILASGPTSLIPCTKTTFNFRADAGADASVLGKELPEIAVDLFKKEIVKTAPPNIRCG